VGLSVGESSAASIEVGVEFSFRGGEDGLGDKADKACSIVAGGRLLVRVVTGAFGEAAGDGFESGFCWLEADVRLTLAAGTPATEVVDFVAADFFAVVVVRGGLLDWLAWDVASCAGAWRGEWSLERFEADRLDGPVASDLAALAALIEAVSFLALMPLWLLLLAFSAMRAALPLATSRLLALSCSFCMITECERSVPGMASERRSG